MLNQIDETAHYVDIHGNSLWGQPIGTPPLATYLEAEAENRERDNDVRPE